VVTVVLPDFLGDESGIIPIQFLALRELRLEIFRESGDQRLSEMDEEKTGERSSITSLDEAVLKRKMEELSLGENLNVPSPAVLQPPIPDDSSREERVRRIRSSSSYKEIAKAFEETRRSDRDYRGTEFSIQPSPEILKKEKTEVDPGTELIGAQPRSATESGTYGTEKNDELRILGPIAQRELAYMPSMPDLKVKAAADLKMKFWVNPDGTVDRVVPLSQGVDAELERVVTDYLQEWRFSPIPENEPQIEEWGTITLELGRQ
jgi:hypothetical protein